MPANLTRCRHSARACVSIRMGNGFTLIECVVFMVIISIGLSSVLMAFNHSITHSVDPSVQLKALEYAQAHLDSVMARKFDEHSPTGGIPACDSDAGKACLGISPDADYDDVGDFNGFTESTHAGFPVTISVQNAGVDLGLPASQARLVTVNVTTPNGKTFSLSTYKVNF